MLFLYENGPILASKPILPLVTIYVSCNSTLFNTLINIKLGVIFVFIGSKPTQYFTYFFKVLFLVGTGFFPFA